MERPVDQWVNPNLNWEDSGGHNHLLHATGGLMETKLSRHLNLDTTLSHLSLDCICESVQSFFPYRVKLKSPVYCIKVAVNLTLHKYRIPGLNEEYKSRLFILSVITLMHVCVC